MTYEEALAEFNDETHFPSPEAVRLAKVAMKKQVPVFTEIKKGIGGHFGKCICSPYDYINLENTKYCRNCGQLLAGLDTFENVKMEVSCG